MVQIMRILVNFEEDWAGDDKDLPNELLNDYTFALFGFGLPNLRNFSGFWLVVDMLYVLKGSTLSFISSNSVYQRVLN